MGRDERRGRGEERGEGREGRMRGERGEERAR
jgi:hypothetical protein